MSKQIIGTDVKIIKKPKNFEIGTAKQFLFIGLLALITVIIFSYKALYNFAKWSNDNEWWIDLMPLELQKGFKVWNVVPREPKVVIAPFIEERQDTQFDKLNDIEKALCNKWGIFYCQTVVAIQHCENGKQDPELLVDEPNGSNSVGLMMINSVHWGKDYCGGLNTLTTIEGNINCAYNVWDRADGNVGDGKGSFNAWSVVHNGCMESKL